MSVVSRVLIFIALAALLIGIISFIAFLKTMPKTPEPPRPPTSPPRRPRRGFYMGSGGNIRVFLRSEDGSWTGSSPMSDELEELHSRTGLTTLFTEEQLERISRSTQSRLNSELSLTVLQQRLTELLEGIPERPARLGPQPEPSVARHVTTDNGVEEPLEGVRVPGKPAVEPEEGRSRFERLLDEDELVK